jgi:hypothetical protein
MKKVVIGLALIFMINKTFAQAFGDGANIISVGFGLPPGQTINQQYDPYKNFINYKFYNYGTVVLKYEHGFHKYFGCGINLEYSNTSANFQYDDISSSLRYQRKISSNIIGAYLRMNGHFPIKDRFDVYGGFGLGYLYTLNKYLDTNPNANISSKQNSNILNFNFQATLGVRYMIKPGFGLFGEIGYATTVCQLGFAFKF